MAAVSNRGVSGASGDGRGRRGDGEGVSAGGLTHRCCEPAGGQGGHGGREIEEVIETNRGDTTCSWPAVAFLSRQRPQVEDWPWLGKISSRGQPHKRGTADVGLGNRFNLNLDQFGCHIKHNLQLSNPLTFRHVWPNLGYRMKRATLHLS